MNIDLLVTQETMSPVFHLTLAISDLTNIFFSKDIDDLIDDLIKDVIAIQEKAHSPPNQKSILYRGSPNQLNSLIGRLNDMKDFNSVGDETSFVETGNSFNKKVEKTIKDPIAATDLQASLCYIITVAGLDSECV